MPLTGSFSGAEFYVVNAFILRASNGQEQPVRWSMRPHSKFISLTKEQRDQADHDFLFKDIKNVWLKGLYWDLVLQLAEPGDPVNDPSQPWQKNVKKL